jgi:hypothetical protein
MGWVAAYAEPVRGAIVGIPEQLRAQGRARVIRRRHLLSLMGAALAALALSAACVAGASTRPHAANKPHKLNAHEKAALRRQLRRALHRDPRAVFGKAFLKKAQAADLSLPLTLRLRRSDQGPVDDALAVEWDASTWAWPGTPFVQVLPAAGGPNPGGVVPIDGRASMEAQFGNDTTGYGGAGVVETVNGQKLAFVSGTLSSPIPVSGLDTCSDATRPAVELIRMDLLTGQGTHGLLSLFGGVARVSLHVRLSTTTLALAADCSGAFGDLPPGTYDQPSADPPSDPVVPISFDAAFRISPAIDADGRLRLGVLTLPTTITQPTTFALISTCVQQAVSGPCSVVRFPARLAMRDLNAEILLGDAIQ